MDHPPLRKYTNPKIVWITLISAFCLYLTVEIPGSIPRVLATSIFNCLLEDWSSISSDEPGKAVTVLNEIWGKPSGLTLASAVFEHFQVEF